MTCPPFVFADYIFLQGVFPDVCPATWARFSPDIPAAVEHLPYNSFISSLFPEDTRNDGQKCVCTACYFSWKSATV
jgi:hypothetical protein